MTGRPVRPLRACLRRSSTLPSRSSTLEPEDCFRPGESGNNLSGRARVALSPRISRGGARAGSDGAPRPATSLVPRTLAGDDGIDSTIPISYVDTIMMSPR